MPENNEPNTGVSPQEPEQTDAAPAQETDWKAQARKWEDRSKSNYTQLQAATAERDEARQELAKFKLQMSREKVAQESGIPVSVLRGNTEDEIRQHAIDIADAATEYRREYEPVAPVVRTQGRSPEKMTPDPATAAVSVLFSGDPNNLYPNLRP